MKKIDWENIKFYFQLVIYIAVIVGLPIMCYFGMKEQEEQQQYEYYEWTIIDKYECVESTWHLIRENSTKKEYHIKAVRRPANDKAMFDYTMEDDFDVEKSRYDKYYIGQKIVTSNTCYPY